MWDRPMAGNGAGISENSELCMIKKQKYICCAEFHVLLENVVKSGTSNPEPLQKLSRSYSRLPPYAMLYMTNCSQQFSKLSKTLYMMDFLEKTPKTRFFPPAAPPKRCPRTYNYFY